MQNEAINRDTSIIEERERNIVNELISLRKQLGISQVELAKITGFSQQSISRFEKNDHKPHLDVVLKIADALGYSLKLIKLD